MPKLSLIRNACPSLQPPGGKCTFSLRSGPTGPERNLRFAPFTRTPPHRTAWAAPEGGCPIPVLPFLCLLCKSFQRTTPPRAHGPLEGESGCKGSTKKADGQKNGGLFWAGRGKFSQKQTKRRAGGKRGALPYGPHTGRAAGTGRGPERGAEGAYSAKHWKMRKRITRRKGPCRAERREETGRHRKRGPPETQKGRTRKAGRAGWKTRKGTPEPPGSPDGRGKGRKRKRGGRTRASPPHCKGKGKKGGMQTGKEKTGQRKRKGKTDGGRDRKKEKKKTCRVTKKDVRQLRAGKGGILQCHIFTDAKARRTCYPPAYG